MKLVKIGKRKDNVVYLAPNESKAWKYACFVFAALAALLILTRCASAPQPLPTDVASLQEQVRSLQQRLQEAEADGQQCMQLLIECEAQLHE